jgi:alpha-N-arabinofuranosidase
VFLKRAKPSSHEPSPLVLRGFDPVLKLREESGGWFLEMNANWPGEPSGPMVTSELLGRAAIPNLPYVRPDGSPYQLDRDFFGKPHRKDHPRPGPFAEPAAAGRALQLWPVSRPQ